MLHYQFMKPVNMPRSTHFGNNYWLFYSKKINRVVRAFSNLEYENLITLEMNPDVTYFCEQPYRAEIFENAKRYQTVFDVWVLYKDHRQEFQEVKYSDDIETNKKTKRQIGIQKTWCAANDYPYTIRTEKEIQKGHYYIHNLTFLAAKVRRLSDIDLEAIRQVKSALSYCNLTIREIVNMRLLPEGQWMDYLAYMLYKGFIRMLDIDKKVINYDMEVINGESGQY